jgi:hypothetical protein
MILTITLILSFLVAFNFLLLKFSCNKPPKKVKIVDKEQPVMRVEKSTPTLVSNQLPSSPLAATGS